MKYKNAQQKGKTSSRNLILKEAFKLFLQKNVEKVTVPDLEKVTGLHRGSIFYHFKDKKEIFEETVESYFFSTLNIFYPLSPDSSLSFEVYIQKKNERLENTVNWFHKEGLKLNPYIAFFHLASQAYIYIPSFECQMLKLLETDKLYWQRAANLKNNCTININNQLIGEIYRSLYIERCFNACFCNKTESNSILNNEDFNIMLR